MPKKPDPLEALLSLANIPGVELSPELLYAGKQKSLIQQGIAEVWRCVKCKEEYYSPIRLLEAECKCGGTMKKEWSAPYLQDNTS